MSRKKRRRKAKGPQKPSAKYVPRSELSPDESVVESDRLSADKETPSQESLGQEEKELEITP